MRNYGSSGVNPFDYTTAYLMNHGAYSMWHIVDPIDKNSWLCPCLSIFKTRI